ncbi:MAG: septal ring lytic transglycosylase RlpA family protein [Thermodesulfobacteriota bacterium]
MIALIPGLQETLAFLRPESKPPQESFAQALQAATAQASTPAAAPPPQYVVQPGDSLCAIAKKLGYADPMELARANHLDNPDLIRVGQVLKLPPKEKTEPVTPAPIRTPVKVRYAKKGNHLKEPLLADAKGGKTVLASWYGSEHHGRMMANGRPYDMFADTAAHRSMPLGTKLCLTNPDNGRQVEVQVTDRGPYVGKRSLDLSYGAARKLGVLEAGVSRLRMRRS